MKTGMGQRDEFFRACAGAVVMDPQGYILAFERRDIPGAWQLPQGGIEKGEPALEAARRELAEETGMPEDYILALRLVATHPEWLVYETPRPSAKLGLGQVQKWFLFTAPHIRKDAANLVQLGDSQEFTASRWCRLEELITSTVYWRKPVYRQLLSAFGPYLA